MGISLGIWKIDGKHSRAKEGVYNSGVANNGVLRKRTEASQSYIGLTWDFAWGLGLGWRKIEGKRGGTPGKRRKKCG